VYSFVDSVVFVEVVWIENPDGHFVAVLAVERVARFDLRCVVQVFVCAAQLVVYFAVYFAVQVE